jgi:hypothetical protein
MPAPLASSFASSADKPVNQMDRLADMGHFPPAVHAGATFNILITLAITFWLQPHLLQHFGTTPLVTAAPAMPLHLPQPAQLLRHRQLVDIAVPLGWTALVLALNLLPVVLLRVSLTPATIYPALRRMNFFRDQHKFSDWVYLAASANMAFWILTAWTAFLWHHAATTLLAALAIAAVATFSPVLLRAPAPKGRTSLPTP